MIWLKKVRKNALPDKDSNIAVYLQEMLEPFDKYLASIKETELTPEIIQDAQFHLYQLMELYIDSRICSRWVTLNPDEKIKFFKNFSREKKLSEFLFFGFDYFSKSEFKLYPDLLKENLTALYKECITDFSNAFKETVKASRVVKDSEPDFEKEDFLDSALSFYLFQGTWTSLRIFPSGPCKYDTILQNNALKPNYDFLNGTLCTFNESLELTPISNTSEFYKLCAEEAILNFIQLGFYIFGDTAKSIADINNLKSELQDLRKIVDENQQDIYNLTEAFENWRKKVSTPKEIITKEEMIANLHENPYYKSLVSLVPDFEKYCDFLLKNELLTYNGSCLCRTDNWSKYYYSNLLYDPFLKLLEVRKVIEASYRKLFGLPESLKLKAQYGDTYMGYEIYVREPLRKMLKSR